ncbi:MAG: hypothetical protein ABR915_18995, partial [Thermoguttaceae bacterium]
KTFKSLVQMLGDELLMVNSGRAMWKSTDQGKTWQQIRIDCPSDCGMDVAGPDYEFSHFEDPLHGMMLFQMNERWRIERTADAGKIWSLDEKDWKYDEKKFLSIIHAGPQAHVYWGNDAIYKSGPLPMDEELIVRLLNRKATHQNLAHLRRVFYVISPDDVFVKEPIWWAWEPNDCLLRSRDGGKTYERTFLTLGFHNIFAHDPRHVWAVGYGGRLSRTEDGGGHWTHSWLPTDVDLHGVYFLNEKRGWVGGGTTAPGCVLQTDDGGVTWNPPVEIQKKTEDKIGIPETVQGIAFRDASEGWVVTHGTTWPPRGVCHEYGRLLHTKDGGSTWIADYEGSPLMAITRRGGTLVAVGYRLGRSQDGTNWQWHGSATFPSRSVAFADDARVFIAGFSSDDAGRTWCRMANAPPAQCVAFGTHVVGWLGGSFRNADEEDGLFFTPDGGSSWQPCKVLNLQRAGNNGAWDALTAVDAFHAWAISRCSLARLHKR